MFTASIFSKNSILGCSQIYPAETATDFIFFSLANLAMSVAYSKNITGSL